ncbi:MULTISPECIES: tRNA (adenosine(37)-N6)-dimethylallyltransferase MiaA [Nocardia]|uniref:tRNA (adenosine(37)-N6)-dimethylallyltransferase MiaA n=1 Tax=Nocardia TaxID=1817 RepID=UPI001893F220|nr:MULTISPECIES: tRNA (adenosine(37)-N6)-dimethylallyltransferase MiaA [Nocardia]MBF6348779.1 tRNA (adenosine(37)-N6)-dimethylallyltransferase MiaA [Nocardia flavorosea]
MTEAVRPVAVVGPTATGKSDLALELAEQLNGEIVNIDAMQLYRGMDIGTAKLPPDQRRGIPHHQFDVLEVTETATVAAYQAAASADIEAIMARGRLPVIVGGSMMYVQALLDRWEFPATDARVRAKWEALLAEGGAAAVHEALRQADPAAAATILPTDGRRMVRALEVVELTGRPFAASAPAVGEPRWGTRILGVDRDTTELDARIAQRTASMFDSGLVEEVRGLAGRGLREGQTARRAIGYAQVLAFLDQEYSLDEARERTFIGTRRYVRRQRSWFRRDHRVRWMDAANPAATEIALSLLSDVANPGSASAGAASRSAERTVPGPYAPVLPDSTAIAADKPMTKESTRP